ncbi:MAG: EamA family transporter RarD [Pelagimonas sp.]|jgi:chloramphenicol-sensitive protein RarD|nr:EamA family transporter RarD [Pelagimonas sp.]
MHQAQRGIWAMVLACLIWGTAPLYYKLLVHVPTDEILAHRTLWSFVTFALILVAQRRMTELCTALSHWRQVRVIGLAALLISVNWFLFIFSIQIEKATESSLGYYIFPLVAVVLGVLFFGERLGRLQWLAVGLAAVGVLVLTLGQGVAPWISLVLATTFGLYGLLKKKLTLGPVVTVTAEVALLTPLAVLWLIKTQLQGQAHFTHDVLTMGLLIFSGMVTALPLILFSRAAQHVPLATMGLIQYINPTGQFLCAVMVFGEPLTGYHVTTFAMIWLALALYSASALYHERARRKIGRASATELAD